MILDNYPLDEELIARWLGEIIHREISKPDDEADMALVEECEKTMLSLSSSSSFSEEELREKLKAIMAGEKERKVPKLNNKHHSIRRIAAIAACVALFLIGSVMTVIAISPPARKAVIEWWKFEVGVPVDIGNITVINRGDQKAYSTIEEMIEAEGLDDLDVIIPRNLPEKLAIKEIYFDESDTRPQIDVILNGKCTSLLIDLNYTIDPEQLKSAEKIEVNGITAYVTVYAGIYTAAAIYKTNVYNITSDSEEDMMTILNCMHTEE